MSPEWKPDPNRHELIKPVVERLRDMTATVEDYFEYLKYEITEAMIVLPPVEDGFHENGYHAGCCNLRALSCLFRMKDLVKSEQESAFKFGRLNAVEEIAGEFAKLRRVMRA